MKVLVTGASGFVGTHLVDELLKSNHQVFALVRTPSKLSVTSHPNLFVVTSDLAIGQLTFIEQLPDDLDACVHTAGIVHSYSNEEFDLINNLATASLIKALKTKYKNDFKFVLISSLAAAGPSELGEKKSEALPDFPVSTYGLSKKKAEESLKADAPKEWISSIIRPPMVIGPGDKAVLDIFKMVRDGIIILPGVNSRKKLYSFVCVFDLVETIKLTLNQTKSYKFYSAHEEIISFEQMIFEIKKQMNKKWHIFLPIPLILIRVVATLLYLIYKIYPHSIRLTPDKINELAAENWTCQANLSKEVLSQNYRFDFSKTIAITLSDYKKRKWL